MNARAEFDLTDAEGRLREQPELLLDAMPPADVYELAYVLLCALWSPQQLSDETREQYNARRLATMHERAERLVSFYAERSL